MKVIKPLDGTVNAERRLVRSMLCMELGAVAVDADLAPLPPPHEPWPTVALGPVTEQGVAATAHYKPAVGIVFYTVGEAFVVREFVGRIAHLLGRAPEDHLLGYRAVAATPFSVMRHRGRVLSGTAIAGPRACYKKPAADRDGIPARLLLWTPPDEPDGELPPHYSARASFTWVFMPVTAALAVGAISTASAFNAVVAALLYDSALMSTLADGAGFERLTAADFDCPPPPEWLAAWPASTAAPLGAPAAVSGALVVTWAPDDGRGRAGTLAYVGQHQCLRAPERSLARDFAALAEVPWGPAPAPGGGPPRLQCVACDAPVGGEAALLRGARAPEPNAHREWYYCAVAAGTPLAPAGDGDGFLLCQACWGALDSAACVERHLRARAVRVRVPRTQAEACAACPGYEGLAPILAGRAEAVPGAPGAFVLRTRDPARGAPVAVVLAAEKLGRYPALTNAAVAALRLPVLTSLRLAETRPPPAGGKAPAGARAPGPAKPRGLADVYES